MGKVVVAFGATSLVGSHWLEHASEGVRPVAVGRRPPETVGLAGKEFVSLDLSDEARLRAFLRARRGDAVWVNFAARTDVDGCERERPERVDSGGASPPRPNSAWQMNAELPGWIAEEAGRAGVPFLHISTDFVFDGTAGPYQPTDAPAPFGPLVSWYGFTKGVGEARARAANATTAILRISYPYRSRFPPKLDFARAFLDRARTGTLYPLYTDQRITPTWIPDVSEAVRRFAEDPVPGTGHVASPQSTTPAEFARLLLAACGLDPSMIRTSRLSERRPVPGQAPRPVTGGLAVGGLEGLGLAPTGFRAGIDRIAAERADPTRPGPARRP